MKTLLAFAALIFLSSSLQAASPFRAVQVDEDGWSVTFHKEGTRFHIEIDGFDRGLSGYLQCLKLKDKERLQLVEKHTILNITPGEKDGKKGISIIAVYRDIATGEKRTKVEFVANHAHTPPAENGIKD